MVVTRRVHAAVTAALFVACPASAWAQEALPPLPPPSASPSPAPPPSTPAAAPPPYPQRPPPGYYYVPPPPEDGGPPPAIVYIPPPRPRGVHAPKYSLWLGARLALLGFGGSFFNSQNAAGIVESETTGNFVKAGPELAFDLGARLARRYIPYLTLEVAGLGAGHRFAGDSNIQARSGFFGLGFRYIGGDVNRVGFLTDLSFGVRSVVVSNDATNERYKMSALELFRLGLGAEIRLTTHMTLEPVFTVAAGSMSDTSGSITYSAAGSADGMTHPAYQNGAGIGGQTTYYMLSLGVGLHFDLFGH